MAGRLLWLRPRIPKLLFGRAYVHHYEELIGNRDIVGWGFNGQPIYADRSDFPFPAIRYKETTTDVLALREKEKGDWRKLSIDEKKELYRTSFCQTFTEFQHPTGEWKGIVGWVLFLAGLGIWLFYYEKVFVHGPLPDSFSEENRAAQCRRIIDLQINPITGFVTKWDYEKDRWKT